MYGYVTSGILQIGILASYMFIICLDCVLSTSGYLIKDKKQTIPVETMTDAEYAGNLALLSNSPVQSESLLHSLGQVTGGISSNVNSNKTEFIYFKQRAISTLNGKPLKLLNHFTYLGSSISST